MLKERVQRLVVGLVVILLAASALGYLLVPAAMLRIVGMDSTPQVTFLVRTLAAALLALSPGAWVARRRDGTSGQRGVLIGLAGYMFASSLVDLYEPVAETACPMFGASRLGQWSACGRTPGPNRGRWEPADAWDHGAVPLGSSG